MIYRYELDEKGRVIDLLPDEAIFEHLPSIEVEFNFPFRSHFYKVVNDKLVEDKYDIEYLKEQLELDRQHRIGELLQNLKETDWKVIVNAELIQAGLQPKYPNLHEERQNWRDEINYLETQKPE